MLRRPAGAFVAIENDLMMYGSPTTLPVETMPLSVIPGPVISNVAAESMFGPATPIRMFVSPAITSVGAFENWTAGRTLARPPILAMLISGGWLPTMNE